MVRQIVLVRAFGGEPLKLVALDAGNGLIYVANPGSLSRVEAGETWPVGVPAEDVFAFKADAYAALRSIWQERQRLDRAEWRKFNLTLFRPHELAA